jgi:hypothetical protein
MKGLISCIQLPIHSGMPLDKLESDPLIEQTIETLVELSGDSLDLIAWTLCELADRLAKASDIYHNEGVEANMSPLANGFCRWRSHNPNSPIAAVYPQSPRLDDGLSVARRTSKISSRLSRITSTWARLNKLHASRCSTHGRHLCQIHFERHGPLPSAYH